MYQGEEMLKIWLDQKDLDENLKKELMEIKDQGELQEIGRAHV